MYRGGPGMLAWALHRLSGLGILFFLILHIADTALILAGPQWYDRVIGIYHAPVMRVLEVVLAGAVLYHGLNGLRIIVMDFWPQAARLQTGLFWAVSLVFVVLFVPAAYFMLRTVFS